MNPQQFMPQSQYQVQTQTMAKTEVIKVNGLEGAKAYSMPSNSSVLLLDESNPIIYFKMTDGAGYPTISAYAISPLETEHKEDKSEMKNLEERIAKLEEVIGNGESYIRQPKQKG